PSEVLLGLLGRELETAAGPAPAQSAPIAPLPADGSASSFIQAAGGQLLFQGRPIQLKGVNYYAQWRPWSRTWTGWDGPQVERELRQGREQLGINVVRVLLPYNFAQSRNGDGVVTPKQIGRLREMAQIAGNLNMRLIVTLFDFYESFPGAGSETEQKNLEYLRALVPHFAEDDRIMAWDVHNEPDHYPLWRDGDPQKVLRWLGRMADEIHALAPRQLVTVGMGQAPNLWLPGPDGRRVVDYSDVVSMHTYDAGSVAQNLDQLRLQTSKPIIIEEFGWPTGPGCMENYSGTTQVRLYQAVLSAAKDRTAGVVAWTLRDYDAGPTERWDSFEEHFGLFRPDGSLKPAAGLIQAIGVPALPSATVTSVPLTSTTPSLPDGDDGPLLIPETGYHVKGMFREAWELLGGRESFGLPLSEAFERKPDQLIVQYFEGALLEYHALPREQLRGLPPDERAMLVIKPAGLGSALAAGRNLPAPQPLQGAFLDFYNANNGPWRLGEPISSELTETIGGVPTLVQYFQQGRLELNPSTKAVRVGNLGEQALDVQCVKAR
ncbi:MAG TPA: cellulase family glycosylhydrolase, partial [Roseiflexaceae bacterium]|nr:cellulase family glycosylhydrolase [Roseiflexaceae bacterium]